MIEEIQAMPRPRFDCGTAGAVIAALVNVLNGPQNFGPCACMGPPDLCLCKIRALDGGRYRGEERG